MNIIIVSFIVTVVLGLDSVYGVGYSEEYNVPTRYNYHYEVNDPHTGDKKQQYEVRNGHVVRGSYGLVEPDGTLRIVEYTAGPHAGFNAIVRRVGHAHHPHQYYNNDVGPSFVYGPHSNTAPTHFGFNHY